LLWLGSTPVPANVCAAAGGRWRLLAHADGPEAQELLRSARVAVAAPNGASEDPGALTALLDRFDASSAVGLILLPRDAQQAWRLVQQRPGQFLAAPEDASPTEIAARLDAAEELQPAFGSLHQQLDSARAVSAKAERTFEELDEEMRLAARLQRDFLPRRLPEVGSARFGVLYRPATWVSGDIYDIIRLDETRLGIFVADAVGHGMPAALLTIFIKKALVTKRIAGNCYNIVPPHVSMHELNQDICEQGLSSCQFCTGVYCVLDVTDLTMTYCRAGHPQPILIHPGGEMERLEGPGSLLGVFPEETFQSRTAQLAVGDRMVIYTDGTEDALGRADDGEPKKLEDVIRPWTDLPRDELLLQLNAAIDDLPPGHEPEDDITVVVMDIE